MIKKVQTLVDEALAQIETLNVEQAQALHAGGQAELIDIRDVRELERDGVVPGAVSAPRGMLEFWVDPASPYHRPVFAQDKRFILFCAMGWRSALATLALQQMGLERVAHIEGGFKAWKEAGAPVGVKPAHVPKA